MPAGVEIFNSVLNQLGSPAIYSDVFANRPAFGYTGRLFISTDTNEIYRDTGTAWVLIGSGGGGVNIYNSNGTLTAARTMTMAGFPLTFSGGASAVNINLNANAGVDRDLQFQTAGVNRWELLVTGAETGSNAGADIALRSYNDAGTFIFAPLTVRRSTGEIETFAEENITTGGQSIIGLYTNSTGTYAGGLTTTGGNPQSSNFNIYTLATAGSVTFANSNLVGTTVNVLRAQVQNAGTITFPASATSALRAATNFVSQLQYNTSAAAGTFTHMANIHLQGVYEVSGGNLFTITNAYQLLLNSLNENGYTGAQLALTNRWGIYQDGASDLNYFAGNTLLGTTTNTGERLQVAGTARVTQSAYFATTSGNVGIGTATPQRKVVSEIVAGNDFNFAATSQNLGTIGNFVAYLYGFAGNTYQKCATFFESIDANARGTFHIALNNATTSANVTIADARLTVTSLGNVGFTQTTFGTSATRTLAISTGTAPSSSPADCFQLYSADITAGNAAAHFRTEGGAVIKVYQETTAVAAATPGGGGGTNITDTDTFDGYTIQQVVRALRNQGLLA